MTTYTDLDCCAECGRLLNSYEEVYCGPCARKVLDDWPEPSDAELAQRDAMIARGWQRLATRITHR